MIPGYPVTAHFGRTACFTEQVKLQFGVQSYMPNTAMVYLAGILLFLLIPAALFVMYQIRRNPHLGARSAQVPQ